MVGVSMNRKKSSKKLAKIERRDKKEYVRLMSAMIGDMPLHSVRVDGNDVIYSYRSEN